MADQEITIGNTRWCAKWFSPVAPTRLSSRYGTIGVDSDLVSEKKAIELCFRPFSFPPFHFFLQQTGAAFLRTLNMLVMMRDRYDLG